MSAIDSNTHLVPVDFDPFQESEISQIVRTIEPQLEIWASCMIGGDDANRSYNESISLLLSGSFNLEVMKQSLRSLIERHDSLRSSFSADGRTLCIYQSLDPKIFFEDISDKNEVEQNDYLTEFSKKDAITVFDLLNGPLFRLAIFKLSDQKHYLTITAHHIICDGWSFGVIIEDLSKLYAAYLRGLKPNLPPAVQFAEYSAAQAAFEKTEEFKKAEQYWINKYSGKLPVLNIPTDFPRPTERSYKSHRDDFSLDMELVSAIKKLGAKSGCSLITTLIAALEVYLYRLTGQSDVVVGVPASGQAATGNLSLVGHCVNFLLLRSQPDADLSFLEYLKHRKPQILEDYDHQQMTFGGLLKKLDFARDPSRVPLAPLAFNIDMGMDAGVHFEGLEHKVISNPREFESFELFINVTGTEQSFVLEWSYNTHLFKPETIRSMMDRFELLLRSIINDPTKKMGALEFLSKTEYELLSNFNNTLTDYPAEKTIVDLFQEQVLKSPKQEALRLGNKTLTYTELNEQSNQLANHLIQKGVVNGDNVGLIATRDFNMIIGMYAIMKIGAAYVPVDPEYPLDRQGYIVKQSSVNFVIGDDDYELKTFVEPGRFIEMKSVLLNSYSKENIAAKIDSKQLAYTVYTSGSTGRPKGVMIEHHSAVNLILWVNNTFHVGADDRLLFITSMCFDLSVYDIFGILTAGGTVVIARKDEVQDVVKLQDLLLKYNITFWDSVPTTMDYLVKELETSKRNYVQKSLKTVFFSGDWIPVSLPERVKKYFPNANVISLGGATEGTVWSNYFPVQKVERNWASIPYGRPIQNNFFYILNEQLQPVPLGVVGELYIGGVGVARGYANDPEKTNYAFVKDPFNDKAGGMMYRTGDLGRMLPNMNMEFIGRKDDQVKIRGFRIELGEIENVLQQFPGILHCAVVAKDDRKGSKRLIGYVVVENEFDKKNVIAHLESKLPDYMVPALFMQVPNIPLTSNGKVDKKSLPDPEQILEEEKKPYIAPRNEKEKLVSEIFAKALGVDRVGITDDFFELGGHSLVAIQVMRRLEEETGQRIPITYLFEAPSVEKLSLLLTAPDAKEIAWKSLVPIKPEGTKPHLYIVHGTGLTVLVFNSLAKSMDPDQPIYGLQARGLNGEDPFETIEELASYYISEILEKNPNGPYCLAGYSFGGIVAFEIARQLKAFGKEVMMVAIFDTNADNSDNFITQAAKVKKKFFRQFSKAKFILRGLGKHPLSTMNYQLYYFKTKFRSVFEKLGLLDRLVQEEEELSIYASRINEANDRAIAKYKMVPYDGAVDLFRVDTRLYYIDDPIYLGWKPYALKGLNIYDIPGDHKTFLLYPNYIEFAKILQECIDQRLAEAGLDKKGKNMLKAV